MADAQSADIRVWRLVRGHQLGYCVGIVSAEDKMPIKISSKFRSAIADQNGIGRDEVEDALLESSGDKCWLCDGGLNIASEDIEVDHDVPVDAGGTEILSNLNMSHAECNRFKRAHSTKEVRNLLRFKRFYNSSGGSLDYTRALKFFGVTPKPSRIKLTSKTASFEFPNGSKETVALFTAKHGATDFEFAFVPVPIEAVFNDDDVQPRLIKLNHAFSIAFDLAGNPLHEAPTARLHDAGNGLMQILMFDGQHKALANWLRHEKTIVYKIYTNISREQATTLVNSIQSKIKKLPLTPFELASKLSDEYADKLAGYEDAIGDENVSEEGFVNWLPAAQRPAAKREIEAAVLKEIADDPALSFTEIVEMRGRVVSQRWKISETAFQNKVLKELAFTKPLPSHPYRGSSMQAARLRERQTIIRCLNLLYEKIYGHLDDSSAEIEKERARRMSYQGALLYVTKLIKKIVSNRVVPTSEELTFIEKTPTEEQWNAIVTAVERLVSHSVWTASFESSDKMRVVQDAFSRNQNIEVALRDAELTPSYCLSL